ncbi:MAG: TRAP transporter small permease [Actinobacteria bacterium]|nr:TRAP transporter small permease [Actinomycetota bacterium]
METPPLDQEPLRVREAGSGKGVINALDKYVVWLSKIFYWVAGLGLIGMLVLVVADIIGIKVFSRPVPGGIEIVTFLAVVAAGFAMAYTAFMHGHVAVDFVVDKLPKRPKLVVSLITVLFSVGLMAVLSYYTFKYAGKLKTTGEVSMTQKIPFYPFVYGLAVCWVLTTLILIREFVRTIARAVKTWTP